MIKRFLEDPLKKLAKKHPLVTLTGPRQSGKTTLAKIAFPDYRYVSLEDPDVRSFAQDDPRGFLSEYPASAILDEVQRAPDLFSYLQTAIDENPLKGRYILTGSQQFLMSKRISQSLAGRTAILRLLPFSLAELLARDPQTFWQDKKLPNKIPAPKKGLSQNLLDGFYPRIHDQNLDASQWLRDYFETYVTRDIRSLLNVGDLKTFEQFVRLLAGRAGQLLNLTSLSNDSGVSHTTARRWISILEASYIIYLLPPHFKNFRKRIIKAPKIHFFDPGLLCFLLRIPSPDILATHSQLGNIFETFVFSEIYKSFSHFGIDPPLYFWRDRSGQEIDLIIDQGETLFPIEVKASQTISPDYLAIIHKWLALPGNKQDKGALVFGGNVFQTRSNLQILPWYAVS